jgi:hypothetical protein
MLYRKTAYKCGACPASVDPDLEPDPDLGLDLGDQTPVARHWVYPADTSLL